jgi:hypothetical protein
VFLGETRKNTCSSKRKREENSSKTMKTSSKHERKKRKSKLPPFRLESYLPIFVPKPHFWQTLICTTQSRKIDRMRTFALGIGECGRKIGLELFRMTNVNTLENMNRMHIFSLIDLADPQLLIKDIYRMGISKSQINVFQPLDAGLPAGFNLFVGRIKPIQGEKGVGGLWFLSREIAREAWNTFYETFNYHLSDKEWYSIFHSAGGGTGCGAGPVFMEKIYNQIERDLSEDLYTATLVLPNEHWEVWREVNSAAAVGRYLRIAQGIFIADNLQGEALVKRAVSSSEFIETENPRELINKRLAQVWISMQMTSMAENEPIPSVQDAASYRSLFSNDTYASILVPCFHEYTLVQFAKREVSLTDLIVDTMESHQLAQFEPSSSDNLIIIVIFPSTGSATNTIRNKEDCGHVVENLRRMYGEDLRITMICAYSESLIDTIKVTILAKDPYIPRFVNMRKKLEAIIADPSEMTKTINRMFPRHFDRAGKNQIVESAEEEFRGAYYNFSQYMSVKGYDNHGRKMSIPISKPFEKTQEALRNGKELELFDFDIAISFAGEDREIAKKLARTLHSKGLRVFYDRFFKSKLWGKDLTGFFRDVYGSKTKYVMILISRYYPVKDWTNFEFSIIREEAERRKTEFILPIRLDDTKVFGIREGTAYLDYRKEGIDGIIDCCLDKLSNFPVDYKKEEIDGIIDRFSGELLKFLTRKKGWTTSAELATELGLSIRVIRSMVSVLEQRKFIAVDRRASNRIFIIVDNKAFFGKCISEEIERCLQKLAADASEYTLVREIVKNLPEEAITYFENGDLRSAVREYNQAVRRLMRAGVRIFSLIEFRKPADRIVLGPEFVNGFK